MYRTMLNSKIHRAVVTDANLSYMGSITIDSVLLEKAGILENEKVQIVNINNGARFETYAIAGAPNSGEICLNGAAARLVQKDDIVIIISYALISDEETQDHKPTVVFVDSNNKITRVGTEELPASENNEKQVKSNEK
ncbi:MAG: aspartate 1-decarboxylase [Clostridia bacterium]|nr:aspartate 1-decarboxylase [Clostridia bacterium]MDD4047998.1 aspartate 1-decarboxylase [Clostridia bacterium]